LIRLLDSSRQFSYHGLPVAAPERQYLNEDHIYAVAFLTEQWLSNAFPTLSTLNSTIMNIAIDGRTIARNKTGVGAYAERLVRALLQCDSKNNYFIFLIEPNDQIAAPNATKIMIPGYERVFRNRYFENFLLPREVRRHAIDIFFDPAYALPFFVRFGQILAKVPLPEQLRYFFNSNQKVKYVVTIHDVISFILPQYFTMKMRLWVRYFVWNAQHTAHRVITDSHSTKNDLLRHYPSFRGRVSVIYPELDNSFQIVTDPALLAEIRNKYGLPDKFILYVGTIEPRKNVEGIAAAYRELPPAIRSQYHLVIGGNVGWYAKKIVSEISSHKPEGQIHFIGYVEDSLLPGLFTLASVFVFPSFYEGFGYPPLEAMACGVPVVSSNRSSLPEVVGDAALLVDPTKSSEISEAILKIISDNQCAAELSRKGLERTKMFGWKKCAEETLKVFEDVMSQG
jgi:glycosyltransferase involved in cell wall biosynthesis